MAVYLTITNPSLEEFQRTALSKAASQSDTVLNVLSGVGFKKGDILLIGEYGEENAEIVYVSDTVDPTTTQITIKSPGLKFPHSENTPVTYMPFDKFRIYQSNDGGQNWFVADTIDIQPDSIETIYVAAGGETSLFKIASYNSVTELEGTKSDAILGSGLGFSQIGFILDRIYDLFQDPEQRFIKSDEMLLNYVNEGYLDLFTRMSALGQGYAMKISEEIPLETGKDIYDLPADFSKMSKVLIDYTGSGKYAIAKPMDILLIGEEDSFSESEPGYCLLHNQIKINPTPKNSNGKMKFYYVFNAQPLKSMTEKLNLPAPDLASKLLVDFALARIYEKAYKPDRASYFLQAFENGVSAWLTAIAKRQSDFPKFVHQFGEDWETPFERGSIIY
ncbi:MAG: hypothetical protein QW228_05780 [Candidatus Aenigmatarchaeota archaeon]